MAVEERLKEKSWYGKDLRDCSVEEQDDVVRTMAENYEKRSISITVTVLAIVDAVKIISGDRITDIVIDVYEKYTHHKKQHRTVSRY